MYHFSWHLHVIDSTLSPIIQLEILSDDRSPFHLKELYCIYIFVKSNLIALVKPKAIPVLQGASCSSLSHHGSIVHRPMVSCNRHWYVSIIILNNAKSQRLVFQVWPVQHRCTIPDLWCWFQNLYEYRYLFRFNIPVGRSTLLNQNYAWTFKNGFNAFRNSTGSVL